MYIVLLRIELVLDIAWFRICYSNIIYDDVLDSMDFCYYDVV